MKILLLDIETAPNIAHVWGLWGINVGINQLVQSGYTLCIAAKWLGDKDVMFFGLNKMTNDDMVMTIYNLLSEADAVIHYNGSKFDMPTLNKEFISLGVSPPPPYKQIDLLHVVKKQFRFTSNKLDYVSQQLGLGCKTHHKGHSLWTDCMDMCPKAWKIMEKYNKQDVLLLEKLYNRLLPWIKQHPDRGLYCDNDEVVCTNCGSKKIQSRGFSYTKTQKYRRFCCTNCGTWLRGKKSLLENKHKQNLLTQDK